jgi:hypothetical protein
MKPTSRRDPLIRGERAGTGHLEGDALDHVDHVLAAIRDRLHRLVQLLPLDHLDGVRPPFEQRRELVAQEPVRLVLQPIHLHRVLVVEGRQRAQAAHRAVGLLRGLHDDPGHLDRALGRGLDLVEQEPIRHRVDQVQHVVETAGERVDVLPIDRGDEGGVEAAHDLVGEGVARVLQVLDLLGLSLGVRVVEGQLLERPRRGHDVGGLLLEQIEELLFPGKQPEHGGILSRRPADVNVVRRAPQVDSPRSGWLG